MSRSYIVRYAALVILVLLIVAGSARSEEVQKIASANRLKDHMDAYITWDAPRMLTNPHHFVLPVTPLKSPLTKGGSRGVGPAQPLPNQLKRLIDDLPQLGGGPLMTGELLDCPALGGVLHQVGGRNDFYSQAAH